MLRSMHMITKRTKIMLGVLVLVAVGAYAYLYWWSQTPVHGFLDNIPAVRDASNNASNAVIRPQVPAPAETPTEDDQPAVQYSYVAYENTEFGFSFDYPSEWIPSITKTEPATKICIKEKEGTGGCLVTVMFEEESVNMNADKALDALRAELRAGRISESSRSIAGNEATRLTVSGYPQGEENATRAAVFTHDRLVFTIKASAGQEAVYDRVVSSFRFQD